MKSLYSILFSLWGVAALADPSFWKHEWPNTDFSVSSVENWVEIMSGGPGRDGIPALVDPEFEPVAAKSGLGAREAVIALEMQGEARAYPLRYLMWHEIVNDEVGGVPVAVTFCPLCNSAVSFDRRVGGQVLTLGVTGKLRASDMVMYDRESESWWQQATGVGIVGEMTGVELASLPSWMESWESFAARNPEGLVMKTPTFRRHYGKNPYVGYDSAGLADVATGGGWRATRGWGCDLVDGGQGLGSGQHHTGGGAGCGAGAGARPLWCGYCA